MSGDLVPRRISVRTGRQQVLLSTVGGPQGQGIGNRARAVLRPKGNKNHSTGHSGGVSFPAPGSSWCKFILNEGANLLPPLTIGIPLWSPLEEIERIARVSHFHGCGGIGGNRRNAGDPFRRLHLAGHAKQAHDLSAVPIASETMAMEAHAQSPSSVRRLPSKRIGVPEAGRMAAKQAASAGMMASGLSRPTAQKPARCEFSSN